MKEAAYYEKLDSSSVRCMLCPHRCSLKPGMTGVCRARRNIDGRLFSLNYGYAASVALDPIEKKPLYHFHPGSLILSAGTFGCNFKCSWCQNWSIAHGEDDAHVGDRALGRENELVPDSRDDRTGSDDEQAYTWNHRDVMLFELTPESLARLAEQYASRGNIGVAYTYNEPTIWYEFVLDAAKLIREKGLVNVLVTNGFINEEPLEELLPYIDAMNIDVKAFTGNFYTRYCMGGPDHVMRTVERAAQRCHVEVTTLVIPGLNDSPEEIGELSRWLSSIDRDIVLHLSRFFPNYKMLNMPPTPLNTLEAAKKSALEHLRHVYLGNV